MYSVSSWRKARRNKVKEKSARFLVAQKECTMPQEKNKHALDILPFQRVKSFVEFGKTVWQESRGKTVSVSAITKATVVCNVHFRTDDILLFPRGSR